MFLLQYGRDLEEYVEEFLDICHLAICDNVCLMEGFRCGLDEDLRFAPWRSLLDFGSLHQLILGRTGTLRYCLLPYPDLIYLHHH